MLCVQGDTTCSKAVHLSDPQLFDTYFEKLLCELTEQDFTDPVLADALRRLKEVSSTSDFFMQWQRSSTILGLCTIFILGHFDVSVCQIKFQFYLSESQLYKRPSSHTPSNGLMGSHIHNLWKHSYKDLSITLMLLLHSKVYIMHKNILTLSLIY